MELIEGTTLDSYVERHRLSGRQIVELMRTVCGAVLHAHQNGVIHRDIKPSNILVTADGQPYLVDFGLAMDMAADDALATLSAEGEVTGTLAYMSPEQAGGHHEQLDTRTDVYSLGVVFYRLLTGGFPYDVKTSMGQTLRNIQEADPIKPSRQAAHLDRNIEAMLLKALAKEPAERYQSVAELQGDMERWLAGMPVLAGSDSSLYLLRKLIARHRYTTAVVGLLLLIVSGFLIVSIQLLTELRRTNRELGEQKERLVRQMEDSVRYAQLAVFAEFLDGWPNGLPGQTDVFAGVFGNGTREDEATRFLQDSRPLSEKIEEFRGKLQKKAEAVKNYRACLACPDLAREDPWLAVWVQSRLYELVSAGNAPGPSASGDGGGP
jgi:hypothetical protein